LWVDGTGQVTTDVYVGIGNDSPASFVDIQGNLSRTLTGTVSVTAATAAVTGTGTLFTQELVTGQSIQIGSEVFTVEAIADDQNLTLNAAHTTGASGETAYADPESLLSVSSGDGSSLIHVDDRGRVGIGTAAPDSLFHVGNTNARHFLKLTSAEWPEIRYETPTRNEVIRLGVAHTGDPTYLVNEGDWYVYSSSIGRMGVIVRRTGGVILDPSDKGNVGIATGTPEAKLDVHGGTTNGMVANFYGGPEDRMTIMRASATDSMALYHYDTTAADYQDLELGDRSVEQMMLKAGGNVGIGTYDPMAKLDVRGPVNSITATFFGGDTDRLTMYRHSSEDYMALYHYDTVTTSYEDLVLGDRNATQMMLKAGGFVGIGTYTPAYDLDVAGTMNAVCLRENGNAVAGSCSSDQRLKQNILPLDSALAALLKLNPVTFEFKNQPGQRRVGLIAQQVEEAMPQLVTTDDGVKKVRYGLELQLTMVNAIKEQQATINDQKRVIEDQGDKIRALESRLEAQQEQVRKILAKLQ